jgi:hypothetical protein
MKDVLILAVVELAAAWWFDIINLDDIANLFGAVRFSDLAESL